MSPHRPGADLEPGRHAHPVDQAEAVLWAADLNARALMLTGQHDRMFADGATLTWGEAAGWMYAAALVLKEVAASAR